MNNKLVKSQLYHAWTNTTSERVSNYNAGYYKEHKDDWRVRREKRKARQQSEHDYWLLDDKNTGNSNKAERQTSQASVGLLPKTEIIKNPPTENSSKEFENVGYKTYDFVQSVKKHLADTYSGEENKNNGLIGRIVYMIEKSKTKKIGEATKEAKKSEKSNEPNPVVKAIKSGFEYLKKWWNN